MARPRRRIDGAATGRRHDGGPRRCALHRNTEVTFSVRLDDNHLAQRARAPARPAAGPAQCLDRRADRGARRRRGAALWCRARSAGRSPISPPPRARSGSGQTNVTAPVSGPDDVRRASTAFNAMAERLGPAARSPTPNAVGAQPRSAHADHGAAPARRIDRGRSARASACSPRSRKWSSLTEQALSLARAGASEEARAIVDLAEIARTLCGELQDMGVNVTAEAPAAAHGRVPPKRNRARAAQPRGERRQIWRRRRDARLSQRSGEAVTEVSDDGPGVTGGSIGQARRRRSSAPTTRAPHANGAGLGLAIAQAIADRHGGSWCWPTAAARLQRQTDPASLDLRATCAAARFARAPALSAMPTNRSMRTLCRSRHVKQIGDHWSRLRVGQRR